MNNLANALRVPIAGQRLYGYEFYDRGMRGYLLSSSTEGSTYAYYESLQWNDSSVCLSYSSKLDGHSVRCIKD